MMTSADGVSRLVRTYALACKHAHRAMGAVHKSVVGDDEQSIVSRLLDSARRTNMAH